MSLQSCLVSPEPTLFESYYIIDLNQALDSEPSLTQPLVLSLQFFRIADHLIQALRAFFLCQTSRRSVRKEPQCHGMI